MLFVCTILEQNIKNYKNQKITDLGHPTLLENVFVAVYRMQTICWTIWFGIVCQRNIFVGLRTLDLGVYDGVLTFNEGNICNCQAATTTIFII